MPSDDKSNSNHDTQYFSAELMDQESVKALETLETPKIRKFIMLFAGIALILIALAVAFLPNALDPSIGMAGIIFIFMGFIIGISGAILTIIGIIYAITHRHKPVSLRTPWLTIVFVVAPVVIILLAFLL